VKTKKSQRVNSVLNLIFMVSVLTASNFFTKHLPELFSVLIPLFILISSMVYIILDIVKSGTRHGQGEQPINWNL